MTRKQRLRVSGNLMQLFNSTQSVKLRWVYKAQLERTLSRLKGKQPSRQTTA